MKIKLKQLKEIIAEEITLSYDKNQASGLTLSRELTSSINNVLNVVTSEWAAIYDETDPSMSSVGEEEWNKQVQNAKKELSSILLAAIEEIQDRLYAGLM